MGCHYHLLFYCFTKSHPRGLNDDFSVRKSRSIYIYIYVCVCVYINYILVYLLIKSSLYR